MKLRDYQIEAVEAAWNDLQADHAAALVVKATGLGKTIFVSDIAHRWVEAGLGRVLILAHRFELIDQAARKFEAYSGVRPAIEMASMYADNHGFNWGSKVIIGSVATMRGRRLQRWAKDYFTLIITDEAHHATSPGYRKIYEHFSNAKLLGVTATPDRSDKKSLGSVFKTVSYQLDIRNAINLGWLVPIRQKFVHVDSINLADVATDSKGDLDASQLDRVMRIDENIHKVAKPTFDLADGRPTLVFASSVAHAKAISDVLNSYRPNCSEYVASYQINNDGSQQEYSEFKREREIENFKNGKKQFLCNCGVFLEGFDAPNCAMVAMARPTKSRSLYTQVIGRGTRPLNGVVDGVEDAQKRIQAIAASLKPDCLVLDFVGNSGKHKLVYADEILFPEATQEQREKARARMEKEEKGKDVEQAMEEAAQEIVQEKHEKERAIDLLRRKVSTRLRAEFFATDVDPFGYDTVVPTPIVQKVHNPPSEKQVKYVLWLAKKAGKRFDKQTLEQMPRKQVQAIIGRLQRQVEALA
ncbi:MAG TPA: DEAD/DEAH box helicase [Gemmatales bacterium]|nr:DEAD/DEAH box helicase [Gemmatales bacterium]